MCAAAGVESEMELAFAVLHQLCAPLLNSLERLPDPQSDALSTAFGLGAGAAPDRYTVSLAVLGLLSEVAEEQPLVCLVDDAQWLDQASAQALAFVARRLLAESVAMVFSLREPGEDQDLSGLPELAVTGLSDADARALLESVVPGRLDERVQDRIVAETRGNPLALVELTRGLTSAELAGGFGRPDTRPLANRLEQSFHRQLRSLPDETQLLLLTVAAEPVGDAALLRRASGQLGISAGAALPAESSGLIEFGAQVRFRHPLVRAAAYRAASSPDRRRVHTRAGGGDRSRRRSRSPGVASRICGGRSRGVGRRRARAISEPGAGPRWCRRGGRVPRTGNGADPRSGPARRAGHWRLHRPSSRRPRPIPPTNCSPSPSWVR